MGIGLKISIFSLFVLSALCQGSKAPAGTKASEFFQESGANHSIIELNAESFNEKVNGGKDHIWFVLFYAPWCPHCRKFAPTFKALAEALHDEVAGAVDCVSQKALCERFRVRAYPVMYLFKDNYMREYTGDRGLQDLAKFITEGYKQVTPQIIYTSAPTNSEFALSSISTMYRQLKASYGVNKTGTIVFLIILTSLMVLFMSIVISLILDCFRIAKNQQSDESGDISKKYRELQASGPGGAITMDDQHSDK